MAKGSYVLLLGLPAEKTLHVGRLGPVRFPAAFYAYVGSAMNGLGARIGRHMRSEKKAHWHIDHLLREASVEEVILCEAAERVECRLARALALRFPSVKGFGSSDCRCPSHLFVGQRKEELRLVSMEAVREMGYTWGIQDVRPGACVVPGIRRSSPGRLANSARSAGDGTGL